MAAPTGVTIAVVLKADELRFTILRPAWRPPLALIVAIAVAVLLTAGVGIARLRQTPSTVVANQYVFRRSPDNDELWEIGDETKPSRIQHVDGFSYISILLARPGQEISALELYQRVNPPPPSAAAGAPGVPTLWSVQGEVIDDRSINACRDRLRALVEKREEIERQPAPDPHAADEVEAEITAIQVYLKDSGKVFPNKDLEKTRSTVTQALGRAYKKIGEHHPGLARHLKETIRSGSSLSYEPRPDRTVTWQL